MIKNILFDLDNTILDFSMSERQALSNTLISFGITPREEHLRRYSEINDKHWKLLELGKISRKEVLLHRFVEFLNEFGLKLKTEEVKSTYERNLSYGYFIMPGAVDMLERLSRSFGLYLVSNGTASVQYARLKGTGLGQYFRCVFISEELGYEKPDSRFFEAAFLRAAELKKEESLVIGDSLTSDIKGGINAGIRTVWFNPAHRENHTQIVPDYIIDGWEALYALLDRLNRDNGPNLCYTGIINN